MNEDLNFAFASGFVASNDSQGLDGIAEPFQIADNTGKKNYFDELNFGFRVAIKFIFNMLHSHF